MKHSFIYISIVMIATSLVACGAKSIDRSVAKETISESEGQKSRPKTCPQERQGSQAVQKPLTEYEKGVLYAYYCK